MDLKKKSVEIIKNLQLKNGGILATPKSGGYPYVYTRDAVIMTKALNSEGLFKLSEKYYYFMNRFSKIKNYREIFHRYNSNGFPCVTRKGENDNEGLLLHGIYDTYLASKREKFLEDMWPMVKEVASLIFKYSRRGLVKTKTSVHEFKKLEKGYEIWANCACWRGLVDASEIARVLNHSKEHKKWLNKADKLKKNILKKLYNKKKGVFIKNKRYPNTPDISQLAPFYFEMVDSRKILGATMKYLRENIWDEDIGGFRRFKKFQICSDWHWYTGGSGSWCALTLWGARFYKKIGNQKRSGECVKWINEIAKKSRGYLPEHIATREEYNEWKNNETEFNERLINEMKLAERHPRKIGGKEMLYWSTPLGWSHAEYILFKNGK